MTSQLAPKVINMTKILQYVFSWEKWGWKNLFEKNSDENSMYMSEGNDTSECDCAVRLKVEFLASGKTGKIELVSNLCNGDKKLEQQAIDSARKVKFEPAIENGKKVTKVKTVEYTFTCDENDNSPQTENLR